MWILAAYMNIFRNFLFRDTKQQSVADPYNGGCGFEPNSYMDFP